MFSKLKNNKFLKNSILYTIGSMMTPLISFIMLPIYTNYLTPAEYGVMTTVQTLVGMFQVLLVLSLQGAVTRFYYDYLGDPNKLKEYLGSIYSFVFLFSTISAVVLILMSKQIGSFLFSSIPINPFYYYMIGLSWLNALFALPMSLLRAQERASFFVMVNIIKSLLVMLLSAYFIIVRHFGAESALMSQLCITGVVVLFLFFKQKPFIKLNLNSIYIKYSLMFSIPMLPHIASGWIIKSSDRIILEKFVDLNEIGIYSLAAQVSMVLALFYQGVNNALAPRYTKLRKDNKHDDANKLLKTFFFIVLSFGIIAIPIAMIGAKILSSDAYNSAIWLIPFLIIGQMIKGFYFIPVANLFYYKKTRSIASSSTIAALINIIINFMLIPIIGIFGAVISTIVAELARMLLIYRGSSEVKSETTVSSLNKEREVIK
ncbi:Membrane protein involved in the export of O-antigen and teichoic acid [Evansella caseinilytica]|uniref:Membrane protein involved in the export of O-antigen and teichoic acid n=1 Tax=Evansella caseinilytica TaxID=1503961 RepID=A0A1H3TAA4_9BACI|nr:Membrane protein involved in the export of O-antigen and teichoic acid [Evansella caseinilytica]